MPAKKITKSDKVKLIFKTAMCAQGLTQKKVAKKFGVTQCTISEWISNYGNMSVNNFELMCKFLSIDPAKVLLIDERSG